MLLQLDHVFYNLIMYFSCVSLNTAVPAHCVRTDGGHLLLLVYFILPSLTAVCGFLFFFWGGGLETASLDIEELKFNYYHSSKVTCTKLINGNCYHEFEDKLYFIDRMLERQEVDHRRSVRLHAGRD